MGPIPEDLIVFLIFGLFVLIQIVRARRRKNARRAAAAPAAATPANVEAQPLPATETVTETPMPTPWTPTLVEGPRPRPPPQARHVPATAHSDTRRFLRRRLLGDRRSLQEAIVIATILGPCLTQRPGDAGLGRDAQATRNPP